MPVMRRWQQKKGGMMINPSSNFAFRRYASRCVVMLFFIGFSVLAADRAVKCIWCSGTGKRVSGKTCDTCNGTGAKWERIPDGKDAVPADREQASKCIWCSGTGKRVSGKPCDSCNSTGVRWDRPVPGGVSGGNNAKTATKCIWCSGTGKRVSGKTCDSCSGTGKIWK